MAEGEDHRKTEGKESALRRCLFDNEAVPWTRRATQHLPPPSFMAQVRECGFRQCWQKESSTDDNIRVIRTGPTTDHCMAQGRPRQKLTYVQDKSK